MKFTEKFVRTFETALHWKSSRPHESSIDRQNSPPDERDAEYAEERAANEAMHRTCDADELEHELVISGVRPNNTRSKS